MLSIGDLGKATGVKVPTIRYYEQIGLLAPPRRSPGNQRLYDEAARKRLAFIRHARDLGCQTIDGLGMVVHQAARAFELYTDGIAADARRMAAHVTQVLAQRARCPSPD